MVRVIRSFEFCWVVLAGLLGLQVLEVPAAFADQRDPRLDQLLEWLPLTEDDHEAAMIRLIWARSDDPLISQLMPRGVKAMATGHHDVALAAFDCAIETAPGFAEAWNIRTVVHALMSKFKQSMAEFRQALELEPRHFGAWAGMAVMYKAAGASSNAIRSCPASALMGRKLVVE